MPDSMYDRLGDMLSDALESGDFLSSPHAAAKETNATGETDASAETESAAAVESQRRKSFSDAEKKAASVLGLGEAASLGEVKKAYREKLKYFHPDRHGDNPVLQKVARDKTRQVIAAWETLRAFFDREE